MSKLFIEDTSLTAIGNAIRGKTGGTELLSVPTGMVDAINGITTGGEMKVASFSGGGSGSTVTFPNITKTIPNFDLNNCLIFFAVYNGPNYYYSKCAYWKGFAYKMNSTTTSMEHNSSYKYNETLVSAYGDFDDILGAVDSGITVTYDATVDEGTITITSSLNPHGYIKVLYVG